MRKIHEQLFLDSESATEAIALLKARLEEGISLLGGLQQPEHGLQDLHDIATDIVMGLTGTDAIMFADEENFYAVTPPSACKIANACDTLYANDCRNSGFRAGRAPGPCKCACHKGE